MKFIGIMIIMCIGIDAELVINHEVEKAQIKLDLGGRGSRLKKILSKKHHDVRPTAGKCLVMSVRNMSACIGAMKEKNPNGKNWECEGTRRGFMDLLNGFKNFQITSEDFDFDEDDMEEIENSGRSRHFKKFTRRPSKFQDDSRENPLTEVRSCIIKSMGHFIRCMNDQLKSKRLQDEQDTELRAEDKEQNERSQDQHEPPSSEQWKGDAMRRHTNKTITVQQTNQTTVNQTQLHGGIL